MKIENYLLILLICSLFTQEIAYSVESQLIYAGQDNSLIDWKEIDTNEWLSYRDWLSDRLMKDKNPIWDQNYRDVNHREKMGRVMSCINKCKLYRGNGFAHVGYRSIIKEGDEIQTDGDSFAWIFLEDGTLLRLSSNSSVSFRDINIGQQRNFLHVRINGGNVLWLSRRMFELQEKNGPETDVLFLPLARMEANNFYYKKDKKKKLNDSQLLATAIADDNSMKEHYQRLNDLIKSNNKFIDNKPTYSMVVLSNGTIFGKNLEMEFYNRLGLESYFKMRDPEQVYLGQQDTELDEVEFYFRGYHNDRVESISEVEWYKVDARGKELESFDTSSYSHLGEMLTKRIPSILILRELWLQEYSQALFSKKIDPLDLAKNIGYRLWEQENSVVGGKNDLDRRIDFLKEYTRRTESSNLFAVAKLNRQLLEDGEKVYSFFDKDYYLTPLTAYLDSISQSGAEAMLIKSEMERLGLHFWLLKNSAGKR